MTGALRIAQRCYTASSELHLTHILCDIADYLEADYYGAVRFGSTDHGPSMNGLTNLSMQVEAELDSVCQCSVDPVMQHLRHSSAPVTWSRATYAAHGQEPLGDALCDFGMRSGLSLALHLSPSQHFVIGVAWGRDDEVRPSAVADLQMLAIHAWPAFSRAWSRLEHDAPAEPLSDRECHCLYWVGRGMTDSEIAQLVGISRRTAERDIQSATAKLNASRRTEAAVIADRLGYTDRFRYRSSGSRVKRLPA